MAFSSQCQSCFFLLLVFASSALQTHARENKFFSKVTRPEPTNPKPETEANSPSASPAKEAATEQGYGLFGQEEKETYQYPPTTTNPTKSAPEKFTYVQSNGVSKEFEMPYKKNNGYHYGAGEKKGMSDTRFLENGRYFYDVNSEKKVENNGKLIENDDGHESYHGYNHENGNHYPRERYGTGEKQGMSDTRFLENGRYFYDIEAEKEKTGNGYSNNVEFYNKNNNENENEEEEEEEEKYEKEGYGTGEKQGMTDTRFMENGRYFYDTHYPKKKSNGDGYSNNVEFYNNNNNYYYKNQEEEKQEEKYKKEGYVTGEKQGMSDTRFLENGRYFYDINAEKNQKYNRYGNNVEFYNNKENYEPENSSDHSSEGQSYNYYEKEGEKYNGNGNGYDFRSTPNKFPNFEFDSMEEYEKYEQNRSHQNVYEP